MISDKDSISVVKTELRTTRNLLAEVRKTYLVELDRHGNPKASIGDILNLWDRVNACLGVKNMD